MARMHTRKKGKSGSRRSFYDKPHNWVQQSPKEIEEIVVQMRKNGMSKSLIGIKLRDLYGIPKTKVVIHKKIGKIIEENGLKENIPEDLMNLINKYKRAQVHLEKNKNDLHNERKVKLIMSRILRLSRYYRERGYLPEGWELSKVL